MQIDGHRLLRVALATALMCLPVFGQDQVVPMNGHQPMPEGSYIKVLEPTDIRTMLRNYTNLTVTQVFSALIEPVLGGTIVPAWSELRVVLGPSTQGYTIIWKASIWTPREGDGLLVPRIYIALNDRGEYVVAPDPTTFPEDDRPANGRTDRHAAN